MTEHRVPVVVLIAAIGAAVLPSLLAYNAAPSPTFLNQALALVLWGAWLAVSVSRPPSASPLAPLLAALAAAAAGVVWSNAAGSLPAGLAWSALGLLAAAALLAVGGASAALPSGGASPWLTAFLLAWVIAGVFNAGIAMVQVFLPQVPDGGWIARSGLPGRAVGNLRQPNHLSSLMVWSTMAVVGLLALDCLRRRFAWGLAALCIFVVVLTASRTGLASVLLLGAWGLFDRRLPAPARALLLATPLMYAAAWSGMSWWADAGAHEFGGRARLAETDISSSRFGIWGNTLSLIAQNPWTGVGFGRFNLAWSLTPFPGRPTAFFDHTHNLPLQLLVELGIPLGGTVLGLLCAAMWLAWRRSAGDAGRRCAAMFVVMIGLHSLLEYPLWYAYFLLPAAWAWGFALAGPAAACAAPDPCGASNVSADRSGGRWLRAAAAIVVLGALVALADYRRVVRIFAATPDAAPLAQRVADGRRSLFFAHHADYAAATSGLARHDDLPIFERPAHYLLDTRLMVAWAKALHAAGRDDDARYLAQRLREFGVQRASSLFDDCATPASAASSFACQAPQRPGHWRHFVPR